MKDLIFASNNSDKLSEVRAILSGIRVISLSEAGITGDIAETGNTLEENAFIKADYVYEKTNTACFADDTGLFVDALNGEPGVFAARYAGENCSYHDNIVKLLGLMKSKTNRSAYFRTVICFIENGKEIYFDGMIRGSINIDARGMNGFGYDPVFIPDGNSKTLAELTAKEKNSLSHRAKAAEKLRMSLK